MRNDHYMPAPGELVRAYGAPARVAYATPTHAVLANGTLVSLRHVVPHECEEGSERHGHMAGLHTRPHNSAAHDAEKTCIRRAA